MKRFELALQTCSVGDEILAPALPEHQPLVRAHTHQPERQADRREKPNDRNSSSH
jgi:hypothetical protein